MSIAKNAGRSIAEVRALAATRAGRQFSAWLKGENSPSPETPLEISIGIPTERQATDSVVATEKWMREWRQKELPAGAILVTATVTWRSMGGAREVPERVRFSSPEAVFAFAGPKEARDWERASLRLVLAREAGLAGAFAALANERHFLLEADEADFKRFLDLLSWMLAHRPAGCFVREVPVLGVDTKWLERHKGILSRALSAETGEEIKASCLLEAWSFKKPPLTVRVRHANNFAAGIPAEAMVELSPAVLNLREPRAVLIVENVQTALSLEAPADVPVLMGMGYGLEILSEIRWIKDVPVLYFGDLDIHGLDILSSLRAIVPQARSFLMAPATFEAWRALAVPDPNKRFAKAPERLTPNELALFEALNANGLRLEQERVPLAVVNAAVNAAAAAAGL